MTTNPNGRGSVSVKTRIIGFSHSSALKIISNKALSVRQTEELVRRLTAEPIHAKPPKEESPETKALEDEFRDTLGTKVSLYRNRKGQGRVVIHFYSEEELQTIYDVIVGGG